MADGKRKYELDPTTHEETPGASAEAETIAAMRQYLEAREREKNERVAAALNVGIDRRLLEEAAEAAKDDREKELLLLFAALPEQLQFKPGATLVIGENGSGKSTLAKALYLAMMKRQKIDNQKNYAAENVIRGWRIKDSIKHFDNAEETAEKETFSGRSDMGHMLWIHQAGLAPKLSRVMKINEGHSMAVVRYADFHEIIGSLKARSEEGVVDVMTGQGDLLREVKREPGHKSKLSQERQEDLERALEDMTKHSKQRGSARQTVDQATKTIIHGDYPKSGPSIFFLDEPESGLSPFRHEKIEELIDTLIDSSHNPGSISVVPTNSTKLYESDLPRIDLRYPERGIFKPSQFPGYFEERE